MEVRRRSYHSHISGASSRYAASSRSAKRTHSGASRRTLCSDLMGIRQNPWTPTTRRGPIAAEAASPGPAVVSLPTLIGKPPQESRRPRAPAFTFGQKHDGAGAGQVGPGPGTYNTVGWTSKGRAEAPSLSLHGRWPPPRVIPTPAPCDYEPSRGTRAVLEHAPCYTIGKRVRPPQAGHATPAPNVYSMPPVLGEAKEGDKRAAPAFSITGRGREQGPRTPLPGPGQYTTTRGEVALSRRPPAFTMAGRRENKSSTVAPGPGEYRPEKVCVNLPWAPAHTFGIRHSPFAGQSTYYPAPESIPVV